MYGHRNVVDLKRNTAVFGGFLEMNYKIRLSPRLFAAKPIKRFKNPLNFLFQRTIK